MHTRRSSVYTVEVADGDNALLDEMRRNCPAQLAGSGIRRDAVFIRIRCANDSDALEAALRASDRREFTLATGYGINLREITSRPPAGCFCGVMPKPSGCLTCTCPDCGAVGRLGISIVHEPGCE